MKFEERHLAQLAAVVGAGCVTEVAALVGLSQPALSRTLSTMEKRLGEPLFQAGRGPLMPLLLDLHSILLSIGMSKVSIRYSGGSLMSVFNCLGETDALTVLPHSVVFAFRKERQVTVLPIKIPQPEPSLGILRMQRAARLPATERLATFITGSFAELRHVIGRHDPAVDWGN